MPEKKVWIGLSCNKSDCGKNISGERAEIKTMRREKINY